MTARHGGTETAALPVDPAQASMMLDTDQLLRTAQATSKRTVSGSAVPITCHTVTGAALLLRNQWRRPAGFIARSRGPNRTSTT
jgi:hypothetical protein